MFDHVVRWSHRTSKARRASESPGELTGLLTVWDRFVRLLPCAIEFVERNHAGGQPHDETPQAPLVLIEHRELVEVLVHSSDIHETDSISGLMTLLEIRLDEWRARALARNRISAEGQNARSRDDGINRTNDHHPERN
ncbi:MAG: hypothetical protein HYV96_21005 [Opitutae bacterium]|nr:hypothetical protein [Opitutae bacterium]